MKKIIIAVLCTIIFTGCSTSKKGKEVPTTLFGLLPQAPKEKPEEETPPDKIPSYAQNLVYKDIDGFPDYIIGVGDILTISMLKAGGQEAVEIKVPPNGKISFSFLDNVQVVGVATEEAGRAMAKLLEPFVKKPRITVVVKEYNSKKIFLLGEVSRIEGLPQSGPGVYSLKGKTTLLKMLIAAGGNTTKADLTRVQFVREGKIYYLNLFKTLTQGGETKDIILEQGDRILIPQEHAYIEEQVVKSRVYILGEVKYPSLIESKTDLTVLEAISRGQGLTEKAYLKKARIVRGDISHPQVIPIDLNRLINKSEMSLNIALQNGDVLYIPTTRLGKFSNAMTQVITVLNAFSYPAIYRDLYTTGGIGVLDTGPRPTGGGKGGGGVTTETLLSR